MIDLWICFFYLLLYINLVLINLLICLIPGLIYEYLKVIVWQYCFETNSYYLEKEKKKYERKNKIIWIVNWSLMFIKNNTIFFIH